MTTALDWNHWRTTYSERTYREHQGFYSEVYAAHPVQRHYDADLCSRAIEQINPAYVVELGGWDGELAHLMLDAHPIKQWTNVEICDEARHGSAGNPRYRTPILGDWYWTQQWTADLFVASHTIEHLTADHLERTIAATKTKAIYLDAPLPDEPTDWRNFTGTHILPLNWQGVDQLLAKHGYLLDWSVVHDTPEESGGQSTARLYRH